VLEDLLERDLRLVVCGTAAGDRSARLGLYYAGRGNKFWRVLAEVGLTPRQLAPVEYLLLPSFGIGLTDLVKGQSGQDSAIRFSPSDPSPLQKKILRFQPRVFCFNGKRAATEFFHTRDVAYGVHSHHIGATRLFVAPSTSGAANGSWDIAFWQQLAEIVQSHALMG